MSQTTLIRPRGVHDTRTELLLTFPDPQMRHSGKVRDSFRFFSNRLHCWLRLVYTTDRRSIFDINLGFEVEGIGVALNAFNLFWRREFDKAGIPHDLVACGRNIDDYLQEYPELLGNPELWKRAIIVRELEMIKKENVFRFFLTGSGWRSYAERDEIGVQKRTVSGHLLPEGYRDGERLPEVLYTPSTKAESGHDLPVDVEEVRKTCGFLEGATLEVGMLMERRVEHSMFYIVDGKLEGGYDPRTGRFMWGDEVGSPDSCRFWRRSDYEKWPAKVPRGYDKEPLRDWGRSLGIHELDPENAQHQKLARAFTASHEVKYALLQRYREVFMAFAHVTVAEFGELYLGIPSEKSIH